jgi:hypothetical protein
MTSPTHPQDKQYVSLSDILSGPSLTSSDSQASSLEGQASASNSIPNTSGSSTSNSRLKEYSKAAASFAGSSIKGLGKMITGAIFGSIATGAILGNFGLSAAALITLGIGVGTVVTAIVILDFLCFGIFGKVPEENILETSFSVTLVVLCIPLGACALSQTAPAGVAFASGKAFQATSFKLNPETEKALQSIAQTSIYHLSYLKGMFETDPNRYTGNNT